MDFDYSVNLYLVIAGTVLGMVVGMFWYSPVLFGNAWLKTMGLRMDDIGESGVSHSAAYAVSTMAHVLLSLVIGFMVLNLKVRGFHYGILLGVVFWLGFNFTSVIKYVFFETRPWRLFFIDAGYDIACFTLIGGIFAQWQ